jgi:hypothetical protein
MHEDRQEVARSALVNGMELKMGRIDMARGAGVFAVEQRYLRLCMDMCVNLPLIVTLVITLELEQVLQAIVTHSAIQYGLDLVLLLAVDESCGWG